MDHVSELNFDWLDWLIDYDNIVDHWVIGIWIVYVLLISIEGKYCDEQGRSDEGGISVFIPPKSAQVNFL